MCILHKVTFGLALGCVLYELLSQTLIWNEVGRKPMGIQRHFFYKRGPSILQLQSKEAKMIVNSCLQIEAKDRPSATVITEKLNTLY